MKALLLLLAVAAGAGFVFHEQLQTWLRPPPPDEVYYLRAGFQTKNADGSVVNWSPGQALRLTHQASAAAGAVALTDGKNVLQVPRDTLTRDVNDAASLRQSDLANRTSRASPRNKTPPGRSASPIWPACNPVTCKHPRSSIRGRFTTITFML